MKLTIEQALQQGITAHKEGKLQDAERLYRAILQSQPAHPDANHNLGLIAVSVNKADAALPLFKTALEANPKMEQFWLSYIDALIKINQFDNAKTVLGQAKNQGMVEEKLNVLKAKLASINEPENVVSLNPPPEQLRNLSEHYQTGQYSNAEELAVSITQEFPKHQFAWKILGALYGQSGRNSEAVNASQNSVHLAPQDFVAHSNLGNTLQALGRLDEAEASFTQAIALKPDFAEAYSNLGNTLKKLGRLDEAEASFTQAIVLKPDYAEAHYNLGNTLQALGRLEEAETRYTQAVALKPNFARAHSNLGNTLQALGRLDEARAIYKQAIALKPDYAEAYSNLGSTLQELGRLDEAEASVRQAIALKPDYAEARYNLGTCLFNTKHYEMALKEFELIDIGLSKSYAIRCSYLQDKESIFYEKLDSLISQGEANAIIGSVTCCSEIKYGIKRSNLFCNEPLQYALKIDLHEQYDFKEIFVKTARDVLGDKSISYKPQPFLTKGIQTAGNIFAVKKISETKIETIIRSEVEKYRIHFKDSDEGFIRNWPTAYTIKGWLVSMQSGGKLAAHMHETGWISGSVYINVPTKSKINSGNLVLCLDEQEDPLNIQNSLESIIDVETGSLCLFPSSLYHYTVPFEDKENRVVLAFDITPTK